MFTKKAHHKKEKKPPFIAPTAAVAVGASARGDKAEATTTPSIQDSSESEMTGRLVTGGAGSSEAATSGSTFVNLGSNVFSRLDERRWVRRQRWSEVSAVACAVYQLSDEIEASACRFHDSERRPGIYAAVWKVNLAFFHQTEMRE